MASKPNKVLVTGGNGFIGRYVVKELLSHDCDVHITVHSSDVSVPAEAKTHFIDLANQSAVKALLEQEHFDSLIHLAWYVGKGCHSSNLNLEWVRITLDILEAFHENGGETFVGAGTVSEYEYKYGYLTEDLTPTNPETVYGEAKNSVYKIAKAFCKKNDISFKWPRIFNLYGPGEKPARLVPSVISDCLNGQDVIVSDCLKYQDYLHVADTAKGIVCVFQGEAEGAVNICSGKPIQLRYIVETIAKLCNFDGTIKWGAIPAAFENDVVVGNNDKLKSMGWKPTFTLEEGLRETIEWWKREHKYVR